MAIGMKKSLSTPAFGVMGLGVEMPKVGGHHHRKRTFNFRPDGLSLDTSKPGPASDKAKQMAEQVRHHSSWRLVASQMGLTADFARTGPQGLDDQPPQVQENMRWPRVTPAWMKHDKQVLRFYAFFQESIPERPDENSRYRQCVIMYFMEDGSTMITEPKQENSGIPQGAFLKRHRVPKPDKSGFVGPADFAVGEPIEIYGRVFHVTGADRFTRWFFEENGIELGPDEPAVEDMFEKKYKFTKTAEKGGLALSRLVVESKQLNSHMLGIPPADRKLTQFLENDGKVLRFYAYWDDPTLYGARIYVICHYFLSDNTFEVNEAHARNSGRDNYPVFYKRGPLLKDNRINAYPGMLEPDPVPYLPEDFMVGQSFRVWGREFVLYACDDFTQSFYMQYMNVDQRANAIDVSEPPVKHRTLPPPPHCGPGREEDSLINCQMIQPKPPKKNIAKLMTLSGELLRFECKMVTGCPEDDVRRLVIVFYAADDEIGVFEIQKRNSGINGGKFCEKRRMKNPETGVYFKLADLAVGKTVLIKSHPLLIIRADEHALQYCEAHPDEFPYADPVLVARKLEPLRDNPEFADPSGIDPDIVKYKAPEAGVSLIDHEIITLIRFFGKDGEDAGPKIDWEKVVAAMD
jgi:hypothetical protein